MCQKHLLNQNITLPIALAIGTLIGFSDSAALYSASEGVADIFISLLKLVSLPIIFLSIVSTAS
ncbi:MAG: dicarboxylate/amino acid:cation symporter, partial [Parachlamydiaceae bacterium]